MASEAISVGDTTVALPGIGSYIALAIQQRDLAAIGWAIGAMLVVILIYDQLLFRPLVAWADRFRFEQETGVTPPRSWALTMLRGSWLGALLKGLSGFTWRWSFPGAPKLSNSDMKPKDQDKAARWVGLAWYGAAAASRGVSGGRYLFL